MFAKFYGFFCSTLEFLTIIKIRKKHPVWEENEIGRFPGYFPLVGLVIGLILWGVWSLSNLVMPTRLSALIIVLLLVVINRGFHLDGLADMADALLSHRSRERMLEIMKDSRQGTFGVLAIVFDIFLKVELITLVAQYPIGIVLFPLWGRLATSIVAVRSTYVRTEGGLGQFLVNGSRGADLQLAFITALIFSVLLGGWAGLFTLALVAGLGIILTMIWKKALGGVTGDLLGASVELGELFSLLAFYIILNLKG